MKDKRLIKISDYNSPCGQLLIGDFEGRICMCDWITDEDRSTRTLSRISNILDADVKEFRSEVIISAILQLEEYFSGERKNFDLPLIFAGTEFRKSVWYNLISIPYGHTISYGSLSRQIEAPSAIRAVANAVGANPISIIVPCHRVIGSNGDLTGYAGGIDIKRQLLIREGIIIF